MQIAAHDVGRLSRILAGCAGVAVAVFGALSLLTTDPPQNDLTSSPAAALVAAGLALLLLALPHPGPAVRGSAYVLAGGAAALGAAALTRHPAAAVATILAGLALACLDVRLRHAGPLSARTADRGRRDTEAHFRVADPLLAGAAIIALVALVPRMFAPTFPDGGGPDSVMSPYYAGALLTLTVGAVLARPEAGPLRTDATAGPATKVRRTLPAVIAVPVIAALVSALAVRSGVSRPAAAISTGAILAALAVLALVGFLVRSLEGADREQRALVAELRERREFADRTLAERESGQRELGERAAELERSNEKLREANTRLESALAFKNDLTSMLTHDVAQPISSIASLSELLCSDWADLGDDIRLELATKIEKNTTRLIKMMNDLQLLFRLDTGSVTARRTPVPILEVVTSVAAELGGAGDVEIAVDDELSALADRQHLWHVVRNLLGNALKYGGAPVEIRAERRDETIVLLVCDHGPGIPEELVPNLFDRFMRGSGLGLFIVRHLVEANGGSVRYERAEPRGARLVVTLEAASV